MPIVGTHPVHAFHMLYLQGPELILYRDMPPDLAWAEVPEQWVHGGVVRLCLGKGTLVPAAGVRLASRPRPEYPE